MAAAIWVDNREPLRSIRQPILRRIREAEEMQLGTGDFMIADGCDHFAVIERKAISDLLSSLGSDRFRNQMERVVTYDHAFLLIEGQWSVNESGNIIVPTRNGEGWHTTGWRASSVQMMLVSWQGSHPGLTVVHTSSPPETVSFIDALWHRGKQGCVMTAASNHDCGG